MSPYYAKLRDQVGNSLLMIPSVAAIVHNSEGELLLQEKNDGTWSLPAGAIEPGESAEAALRRELLEETGMVTKKLMLINCFGGSDFRYTYPNGDQVEYVVMLYRCLGVEVVNQETDPETVNLRFFSRGAFPGLELPYPLDALYSFE